MAAAEARSRTAALRDGEVQCLEILAANHMSLLQLELARAALRDLARISPARAVAFLRRILDGAQVPREALWRGHVPGLSSACHLRWFCSLEYLHAVNLCFKPEAPLRSAETGTRADISPTSTGARTEAVAMLEYRVYEETSGGASSTVSAETQAEGAEGASRQRHGLRPGERKEEREVLEAQLLCAEAEFDLLLHILGISQGHRKGISEVEIPGQAGLRGARAEGSAGEGIVSGRNAQGWSAHGRVGELPSDPGAGSDSPAATAPDALHIPAPAQLRGSEGGHTPGTPAEARAGQHGDPGEPDTKSSASLLLAEARLEHTQGTAGEGREKGEALAADAGAIQAAVRVLSQRSLWGLPAQQLMGAAGGGGGAGTRAVAKEGILHPGQQVQDGSPEDQEEPGQQGKAEGEAEGGPAEQKAASGGDVFTGMSEAEERGLLLLLRSQPQVLQGAKANVLRQHELIKKLRTLSPSTTPSALEPIPTASTSGGLLPDAQGFAQVPHSGVPGVPREGPNGEDLRSPEVEPVLFECLRKQSEKCLLDPFDGGGNEGQRGAVPELLSFVDADSPACR